MQISVVRRRSWHGAVAAALAVSGLAFVTSSGSPSVAAARATLTPPDMRMVVLKNRISLGSDSGHTFLHFSHVTSDFGPGPFEIDPHYNSSTGVATFSQALYNSPSPGVWKLDHKVRLGAIGVYHEPDYDYPLNSFVLLNSKGNIVARSPKTDYCITGDYQLAGVPNTPGSTFISPAKCADPNASLGWSVGWGDHYDQTDNGQPIDITNLANGTYTLRGIVDPAHVLTETDKTNDVTDTRLTFSHLGLSDAKVTVGAQTRPRLPLPSVSITAPTAGQTVRGSVALKAKASASQGRVTSVQFLVDGAPVGTPDTTAPYVRTWSTGAATAGTHYISARATTSKGIMNTARLHRVTLQRSARAGADRAAPSVYVLNPVAGQTVSGTVPLAAHVTDDVAIRAVRFSVDGHRVGVARRAPYAIRWDTTGVRSGRHRLTAQAVDRAGHVATTRQRIQVQNPAPPMTCFVVQSIVHARGTGAVRTPAFRTAVGHEVLLAMVSADGPGGGVGQAARVTGGGLTWHLVERANASPGDAEVWAAHVHGVRRVGPLTSRLAVGGHAQRLTVVALEGVEGVGARAAASGLSGRPHASVAATGEAASLVFAAGTSAVAHRVVLPTGQIFAGRSVERGAGATFWSEYTNQAVAPAGTTVTMRALRPTSAPWNLVAVEAVGELE